jgi:GNAT superfamily N-acetyltransferase
MLHPASSHLNSGLRFGRITYQVEKAVPVFQPYQSLGQDEFRKLLQTSGLDDELQGAADSKKRLPDIYQPKPFIVVARDEQDKGKAVGVAGFVNLGEYDFLSTLAVDKAYQQKGIGQELIRQGVLHTRAQYQSANDSGHTSLATLTASDSFEEPTISNKAAKKYGFQQLPNAAVLSRKTQAQNLRYLA